MPDSRSPRPRAAACLTFARRLCVALGVVCLHGAAADLARAQGGDVLIFPKRVVFEGRQRVAELTLVNRGNADVTYRLSFEERRMTDQGSLVRVALADASESARRLLRYAPRQVRVRGGERQTIRLALRKPEDLEPGEYRSHLLARALPPADGAADVETLQRPDALGVRLTPLPGISVPVIVRHGALPGAVALSELALGGQDPDLAATLRFRLSREGSRSVYGDLVAHFTPRDGGDARVVGRLKGIAVYPPLASITRQLRLEPDALGHGSLRLRFESRPESDGGGPPLVAEAEVVLP